MMTRADALNMVRWKAMEITADHEVRFIFSLWEQGYSLPEITQAMEFTRDWNTKAIAEGLRQVEHLMIDEAALS